MQNFTAYIDVTAIAMVSAAAAGALVTIGAVISSKMRKVKKTVNDKLGIDENRNKEVEADLSEGFGETIQDESSEK